MVLYRRLQTQRLLSRGIPDVNTPISLRIEADLIGRLAATKSRGKLSAIAIVDNRATDWTMVYDYGTNSTMRDIAISKFKATCLAVLEDVRRTGAPVTVTRFGRPVAEIVPPRVRHE